MNYYNYLYNYILLETFIPIYLLVTMIYLLMINPTEYKSIFLILLFIGIPIFILFIASNINEYYISYDRYNFFTSLKGLLISETVLVLVLIFNEIKRSEKEKKALFKFKERKIALKIRERKLINLGEMLNNIAHQWKQPLSRINSILFDIGISYKDKNFSIKELERKIKLAENETKDMTEIMASFISYLHPFKKESVFNFYEFVKNKIDNIDINIKKQIRISLFCQNKKLLMSAFKKDYEQVINVILENAIYELKKNPVENPEIIFYIDIYNKQVRLRIKNNGSKILSSELSKIFQPYYTTKKNKGTGIGLYMCKMLIENGMKKELRVKNRKNGVTFTILG